jgi:hypothetical protein
LDWSASAISSATARTRALVVESSGNSTFVEVLAKLWVIDEIGDNPIGYLVTLRHGPSTSQFVGDQGLMN